MSRRTPTSEKDSAKIALIERYNLKKNNIIDELRKDITWKPDILWKTKTHYIALEISDIGPFRPTIEIAFGQITLKELPVKIYIAYPKNAIQQKEAYQRDLKNARMYGTGVISIDSDFNAEIEKEPISIPLVLDVIDYKIYKRSICPSLKDCYATYMNGNPQQGLQNLGQLVESKIKKLGDQAIINSSLKSGGYRKGNHFYPIGNLIDELMQNRVIDNSVLGRCRGFIADRNSVSHEPRTINEAKKTEKHIKDNFKLGLRILEELPNFLSKKGYKF